MREGKILIVSSDRNTFLQLESALTESSYSVTSVSDPARAKLQAHKEHVDLLVIDLTCRDFDGGTLAQELRRVEFSHMIPILFLVHGRDKKSRPMRPRFGITDYVTKPFNPDEVVARVRFSLKYGADAKESDREKTVEGSLAEVSLIDLIQIFFQSKKEGYLIVNGESEKAYIYFKEGKIINARVGNVLGLKALYRLFTWNTGNFGFFPGKVTCSNLINMSTENILLTGLNQIDEFNRMKDTLPPPRKSLRLKKTPFTLPKDTAPEIREVVHNVDLYPTVKSLLDNCTHPDLEVYRAISTLLESGILEVVEPEKEDRIREEAEPLMNFTQTIRLREILVPFQYDDFKILSGKIIVIAHTSKLIQDLFMSLSKLREFTPFSLGKNWISEDLQLGPIGFLNLNDRTEISLFLVPPAITNSPLWSIFSKRLVGTITLIDSQELQSLVTIRDTYNFYRNELKVPGIISAKIGEGKDVLTIVFVRKMLNLPGREKIIPMTDEPEFAGELLKALFLKLLSA